MSELSRELRILYKKATRFRGLCVSRVLVPIRHLASWGGEDLRR